MKRSGTSAMVAAQAVGFLLAGAGTRLVLQRVETRWQLAAFGAAIVAIELVGWRDRMPLRLVRPVALCAAAFIGVVAAKAYLEPDAVHAAAKTVKTDLRRAHRPAG